MTNKNMPWGAGTPWKNQTAFFTFLRGGLRRVWNKHPSKLEAIKAQRKQVKNPNPRGNKATVWGAQCVMCKGDFISKEIQVDHIVGAGQLNEVEDIQGFTERLLLVRPEDLRMCCKFCNSCLSYADKYGGTYEDAVITKRAIEVCKLPAKKQNEWLTSRGVKPAPNAKDRRVQVEAALKEGK